jgi:hypothetical protein
VRLTPLNLGRKRIWEAPIDILQSQGGRAKCVLHPYATEMQEKKAWKRILIELRFKDEKQVAGIAQW